MIEVTLIISTAVAAAWICAETIMTSGVSPAWSIPLAILIALNVDRLYKGSHQNSEFKAR
jgi:hypothetical protein